MSHLRRNGWLGGRYTYKRGGLIWKGKRGASAPKTNPMAMGMLLPPPEAYPSSTEPTPSRRRRRSSRVTCWRTGRDRNAGLAGWTHLPRQIFWVQCPKHGIRQILNSSRLPRGLVLADLSSPSSLAWPFQQATAPLSCLLGWVFWSALGSSTLDWHPRTRWRRSVPAGDGLQDGLCIALHR
jgi:hypothetical protein